jgi:hypothetical protein
MRSEGTLVPDERSAYRTREQALEGRSPAAAARAEIAASWRRVSAVGLDPGTRAQVAPLAGAEVERRRTSSGIAPLLPQLTASLASVTDAGHLVVVADAEGRVLWRFGSPAVRRHADALGFVGGSAWTEGNVGTNAIGTALVTGEPVQIRGAEHYVEAHTRWGCVAAPLRDPWTGRTLGVVDVSGPSQTLHPAEFGLVSLAASCAASELVESRRAGLERLRAVALPLIAKVAGPLLVVDGAGHVALAAEVDAPTRVALPSAVEAGGIWLPTLGAAVAEPLAGGWLLRMTTEQQAPLRVDVDLAGDPVVRVVGASGSWCRSLSPRHAELVLALARAGATGRSASELAADLFADPSRVVTVRAEMSRLRRLLGGLLAAQPYRFTPGVDVRLLLPADPAALLVTSSAPVVLAARR